MNVLDKKVINEKFEGIFMAFLGKIEADRIFFHKIFFKASSLKMTKIGRMID